jgi:pilus assembly protein CpaB
MDNMFSGRTISLVGLALLLALCAAWMANRWLENATKPSAGSKMLHIAVASREIPFGALIEESQVKLADWPKDNLPVEYFTDTKQVIGEVSTQTIYPGDVFNKSRIRDHLGGSALSALIEPNMRAVSVRVNDVIGVSGFLLPGNRVDILATRKPNAIIKETYTETLLQDVKVLAIDQEASMEKNKPVVVRSVTLEVHPGQAELLAKATEEGSIQLALRNPMDHRTRIIKPALPKPVPTPTPVPALVPIAPKPKPMVIQTVKKPALPPTTAVTITKGTRSQVLQCTDLQCNPSQP